METIILLRPDDWHVHLRDGSFLEHTVPATAMHFNRALVMPNLKPALTSVTSIKNYRDQILKFVPAGSTFTPCMTLYLNNQVDPEDLKKIKQIGGLGGKLYPANATTNAEAGPASLKELYALFDIMQSEDLVLQVHGEVAEGDIFEREEAFVKTALPQLLRDFPRLRIVLEHISTQAAVDFVKESPERLAATITPQHLWYHRNHLLAGGVRPHYYCLPILKHERDQKALQMAATSGNPKFFAGTDSAPHALHQKESACGCAGIFSAPYAVALYAHIFDSLDGLENFERFMSRFGADFYQLPYNQTYLTLRKQSQTIPETLPFGKSSVVPMGAGTPVAWSVVEN
ncbi:MAG: dihydroorotase [Legionella sp.]|nr:dihydroorotase [Legionella sp.]